MKKNKTKTGKETKTPAAVELVFPVYVYDKPEGVAVAWDATARSWEAAGDRTEMIAALPPGFAFKGYASEGVFTICDLVCHARQDADAGTRVSLLHGIRRSLQPEDLESLRFVVSEKVGDAEGLKSVTARMEDIQLLK